jgi:hypothetical protein
LTDLLKLRTVFLGLIVAGSVSLGAAAQEAKSTEAGDSDQYMSVDEAADNFVEDSKKVGDKAEEVGSDIAEEAEDAYDSAKESVQDATE